jgi:hypothetical protein
MPSAAKTNTQDGRFVSSEAPTQKWRATKTGYEDLIGDPTSRYIVETLD